MIIVGRPWHRGISTVACLCTLCCASCVIAGTEPLQGSVELVLSRPVEPDEAVWLQISVGVLPRGAQIRVYTKDGVLVGTVSPFGARASQSTSLYTLPLPKDAATKGKVQLRLEIEEPGASARAPRSDEVERMNLIYVPITK